MRIGDIVNVKNPVVYEQKYWKGKVTEIHNTTRITVQDKGINFAELDLSDLEVRAGEYWEK